MIPGIGPVMARRVVKRFGLETLEVIERHPEKLAEVEGIGPLRSERIREAWAKQSAVKQVMIFLHSHGIPSSQVARIYRQYGDRSVAILRENPYRLAEEVMGIGFLTADRIAASLGVSPASPERAEAAVLHVLRETSDEGHVYYPWGLLAQRTARLLSLKGDTIDKERVVSAIDALATKGKLAVEPPRIPAGEPPPPGESAVYLKSLCIAERECARRLASLIAAPAAAIRIDRDRAVEWFERTEKITLGADQREALRAALTCKLMILTGGPGTGKTTLVKGIIRILEKKQRRILLCAPTGRAAKRLSEATGREAKTIHRLLEFSPRALVFLRDQRHPLEADLIVVDEISMVDLPLFARLLEAVPPSCGLLLVGDTDQLPSVGPGNVLRDLIRSGAAEVCRLTEIYRQSDKSLIVLNAHRVNRGEMPILGKEGEQDDFFFIERQEPEKVLETVKKLVARRIPARFGLDPLDGIQVLTPMQKGLLGAANLNAELQGLFHQSAGGQEALPASAIPARSAAPSGSPTPRGIAGTPGSAVLPGPSAPPRSSLAAASSGPAIEAAGRRPLHPADKVMQIRNNYEIEVFNGDIGRILRIDPASRQVQVRFEDRIVSYEASQLDDLVLAYACTIHKSQGSEYPAVVIPLHTQHSVMLQRNLLYTGLTRGKRLVVLVGSRKALAMAVKNDRVQQRYTRLAERLCAAMARP